METRITHTDATARQQQQAGWNQPCSEDHLAVISDAIADWRAISPFLGLTEAEEIAKLGSNPHSVLSSAKDRDAEKMEPETRSKSHALTRDCVKCMTVVRELSTSWIRSNNC